MAPPKERLAWFLALTVGLVCAAGCASTPKSTCPTQSIADRWKLDESPYKEYIAELRKAVAAKWDPLQTDLIPLGLDVRIEKPQRVVVASIINADGSLMSQRVCLSSNHATIDESVMKAMREAQPFGPVPPFLLDPNGKFRLTMEFNMAVPKK